MSRRLRRSRFTPSKVQEARRILNEDCWPNSEIPLFAAKQNGDDLRDAIAEAVDAKPMPVKRFRISMFGQFYTVVVDRDGRNLSVPSISISGVEGVSQTVTYSIRDRVTGTFVGQIAEEMEKLGYEHMQQIVVFALPKNDRGADFVVYNKKFVEELDT